MCNFDGFGQVRECPVVSAANILLGDGVPSHPYAFLNAKNIEFHAMKHNEYQANLIAGVARLLHHLQGLAARKSSFVNEALRRGNQVSETRDDLPACPETC